MLADPDLLAFESQMKAGADLRTFAYLIITGQHHGVFERKDYIGLAMFYRCLQTHEAIELVVKPSLVDDGLVLVRSLVEHAVNAVYMLTIADAATADAFAEYGTYLAYEQFASLKAVDADLMRAQVSAEQEDRMRDRYNAVRSKFENKRGDKWCADDALYKRALRLDYTLRLPEIGTEWRLLVNGVWRLASRYTHGTAQALAGLMKQDSEVTTLERKATHKEAAIVLQSANTALYLSLLPVAGRLGLDVGPIHEMFREWVAATSANAETHDSTRS